jgi:hypothetical protein
MSAPPELQAQALAQAQAQAFLQAQSGNMNLDVKMSGVKAEGSMEQDQDLPGFGVVPSAAVLAPLPETSELETLLAQLAKSPVDPPKWYRAIDLAEASGDIGKVSKVYDALLAAYPNTVRLLNGNVHANRH